MTLSIDPEFKNLIPKLAASEYSHLEESIKNEGCKQPITHWNGVIVDGHNRFEICQRLGISYQTEKKEFSCREEAISWICLNQLSRRNITEETRKYLIGKRYEVEKAMCYQRNAHGVNQYSKLRAFGTRSNSQKDDMDGEGVVRRTSKRIGDEYHLAHSTVERYGQYSRLVDEIGRKELSIVPQLLSGELNLSFDNTLRLAAMNKPDVNALKDQLAYNVRITGPIQTSNQAKPKQPPSYRLIPNSPEHQVNVKTKPTFDPDAEINGLTMTIPAWMNSISRVKENAALDQVSHQAKEKLVIALKELQGAVDKILQKVGA